MTISSLTTDLQGRAQAALATSPFYELRDLRVERQDSSLLISGVVTSFYHKQLAQEVVSSVCKDAEVMNAIRVEEDVAENAGPSPGATGPGNLPPDGSSGGPNGRSTPRSEEGLART